MKRFLRLRPSPAMVVAIVALVAATTGVAAAAGIPGHAAKTTKAKKHATPLTKAQVNKLIASYVKRHRSSLVGPAGPAGAPGAAGAAGVAGAPGPKGDTGPSTVKTFNTTIASAGTLAAPAEVTLVADGPISVIGKCWVNSGTTYATGYVRSSTTGAVLSDYGSAGENVSLNQDDGTHANDVQIEYQSSSASPSVRDFEGPYDGTFAAQTADLATYFTGSMSTGTYVGGAGAAPCSFAGFVVES